MIKSVVREHKWLPEKIGSFFIDDGDMYGLEFWYLDCIEIAERMNPKKNKK
jgi:hypothetical protein